MELEELTHIDLFEPPTRTTASGAGNRRGRLCTTGCGRPTAVCLCDHLPSPPIETSTKIIILQHPHEARHKLSTVPLLSKSLLHSQTLIGRRLRRGLSPFLDSLHTLAVSNSNIRPNSRRALFLFPSCESSTAIELEEFVSRSRIDGFDLENLVLIVFDGTWKHAKEMLVSSLPFLSNFAVHASLKCDFGVDGGSIYNSELILRREPFGGCVSTMEAVARTLRVLEPNGVAIEEQLLRVLRAMVMFQASYLKPMKPRPKLVNKKMMRKMSDVEELKNENSA
ncbi:DTW protein [Dillenia turbinata]|uniref:tRNA-uridine aminocarboxypropyltransferase n=1 Tax=Dillenia turbinata TaxID=194707 RepID=A0AAN8ZPF5_9MAGN